MYAPNSLEKSLSVNFGEGPEGFGGLSLDARKVSTLLSALLSDETVKNVIIPMDVDKFQVRGRGKVLQ